MTTDLIIVLKITTIFLPPKLTNNTFLAECIDGVYKHGVIMMVFRGLVLVGRH